MNRLQLHNTLTLCFCFLLATISAQSTEIKNGIGIRAIASDYQTRFLDDNPTFIEDYGVGLEITYNRNLNKLLNLVLPLTVGATYFPTTTNSMTENRNTFGSLDALLQLQFSSPNNFFVPYIMGGIGGAIGKNEDFNVQFPAGLGLNFRVANNVYLSAQSQYRFSLADNRDNLQHSLGFLILLDSKDKNINKPLDVTQIQAPDADNDGIDDTKDRCPNVPGLKALMGCPDSDNDGFADGDDDCPNEAGVANGCPDSDSDGFADSLDNCPDLSGPVNGCPDSDNDGIANKDDACPNESGLAAYNGCPNAPMLDTDGDGVDDDNDSCPNKYGLATLNGCPDSDNDGVADYLDKCPNNFGETNNNGCPVIATEERAVLEEAMRAVRFETASATLKSESSTILNRIADILRKYTDYKMSIHGYTDSVGSRTTNLELSKKRAKACYDYLITQGITANRLSHDGFGEQNPIGDNRYKDGREQNRRVEFILYLE